MNRGMWVNKERLWSLPQPVLDNSKESPGENEEYRNFLMCVLYAALGLLSNTFFGLYAINVGEVARGLILFAFSGIAAIGMFVLWIGRWYKAAKHFIAILSVLLLLQLFQSGGLQNTGPMYYFIFPSVALFLNGRLQGLLWISLLLVLTLCMWHGVIGITVDRYDSVYVMRIIVITLIITLLELIPAYFRRKAEHELILSRSDVESLSYADQGTQLANRTFLEKFLSIEFNRSNRYGSRCCLLMVEAAQRSHLGRETGVPQDRQRQLLASLLQKSLRLLDVAGLWERNLFLIVLPETDLAGGQKLAHRLMMEIRASASSRNELDPVVLAFGICSLDKGSQVEALQKALENLELSRQQGGGVVLN